MTADVALVGRIADLRSPTRASRGTSGRTRTASSGSTRTVCCRATSKRRRLTGVAGNFWLGLGLLHTLFTHEHNAICDALKQEHPTWSDDRLFEKARLVNAALMAKIHTVEWTPAIIAHPTTQYGMRANWCGILGERHALGRLSKNEVLGGIPGSKTDHHGVPYSLTEEFVAVYRMHPLLPDDFTFRSLGNDSVLQERTFPEIGATETRARLDELGLPDALYSFGVSHPGAITLHNYPRFLQQPRPAGRRDPRPRGARRAADPRAGRAALQRLPPAVPHEAGAHVRGADPERRMGRGAPPRSTATSSAST